MCTCVCVHLNLIARDACSSMLRTSSEEAPDGVEVSPVRPTQHIEDEYQTMMLPSPTFSPGSTVSPINRPTARTRNAPGPGPRARKSLPFETHNRRRPARRSRNEDSPEDSDAVNVHAPTRTVSWPRSDPNGTSQGARVEDLCGDGYEFVTTRLSRGVRIEVTRNGVVIVPNAFGLSLSHPPGSAAAGDVQIDKFNIVLEHRRQGHGTEIMRRLARWYLLAGSSTFSVPVWTDAGRRFYKKCGFKKNVMGEFVLQLKDAENVLNSTRRARVALDLDTENTDGDDCVVEIQGSVCFQSCDEQMGNSCGPHAVRNALLALGNGYAAEIDMSRTNVPSEWIDTQLDAAARAMYDPLGLVRSHVLHIEMLGQLNPSSLDKWHHGVDPIVAMMSEVVFKNMEPDTMRRQVPNKVLVLTSTQESWDWKSLSHFICIEISWEISDRENNPRLDICVLDSSEIQRELHGAEVIKAVNRLRNLLVPTVQSLRQCMLPRIMAGPARQTGAPSKNLDSQSTTAGCEEAPSPSHVGNGGGSTKVLAVAPPAATTLTGPRGVLTMCESGEFESDFSTNDDAMSVNSAARTVVCESHWQRQGSSSSAGPSMSCDDDVVSVGGESLTLSPGPVDHCQSPLCTEFSDQEYPDRPRPMPSESSPAAEEDDSWLTRLEMEFSGPDSEASGPVSDIDVDPDFECESETSVVTGTATRNFQNNVTINDLVDAQTPVRKSAPRSLRRARGRARASARSRVPDRPPRSSSSGAVSETQLSLSDSDDHEDEERTRERGRLLQDVDRLSTSSSKRRRVSTLGGPGALHASGYRHVDHRLDKRRKGKPSVRKGVKHLQEKYPNWTIEDVGDHSTYIKIQERGQPRTFCVSVNRAAKAMQLLEYRDCVNALLPEQCSCSKRCYDKLKAADVLALRGETFEQNADENSVTDWLVTRLRAVGTEEDGFPFVVFGHEVCSSFYARAHGVGRNKALSARALAATGARPAPRKRGIKLCLQVQIRSVAPRPTRRRTRRQKV